MENVWQKEKEMKYILDMISDTSNHINSKIVMGIISFIVASILAFIGADNIYVGMFLTYSAGALGWSCFDNNSAFKFQKTETNTTKKDIEIKANAEKLAKELKRKK